MFRQIRQGSDESWTYLPWDPVRDLADMRNLIKTLHNLDGWCPYAVETEGVLKGFIAYLRVAPLNGVLEVGGIYFSPVLQRTTAATEAVAAWLLADNFDEHGIQKRPLASFR